ncbi:hypothetical protein X943_003855 [Babesia divergens]|uniref:Bd37 core domain-containing protein n=1 Tax=Babesia divergens TaxID=32595 RepID=A0AAD9LIP4_BABDI|nr:hypothetical protein X943_003855 [Babesia divergens]
MMFLGILRASALYLLAIGFHSQHVSCGILNRILSSKKSSNANVSENSEADLAAQVKMLQEKLQALEAGLDKAPKESFTDNITDSTVQSPLVEEAEDSTVKSQDAVPEDRKKPHGPSDFSNEFNSEYDGKEPIKEAEKSSEEHEQYHVARKTETDVTSYPSTINLSGSSKNPDGSTATPSSNGAAEHEKQMQEKLMKEIAEERKELVERLSKSDAPFSLEDMTFFYGMLKDGEYVDPEAVLKIGEKIHTFLGNFGIHGEDAKASLAIFMEMIQEYVMGLLSSTKQLSNEERAEMRKTVAEILEQLPKSHVNTQANDYDGKEDSSDERSIVDMPEISENSKESIVESPLVNDDGDIPGKSPRKLDHDLSDELNVESPKELEDYDELNGGIVHKSKIIKAGNILFEHHSAVKSQDAVPEDIKKPHGPSDFSNDSGSEHDEREPIQETEKSNKEYEQQHVARKTETDVTSYPSTINLSGSSKNPDGSTATPSSNGAAEHEKQMQEKLMQEISEQRTKLVERLSKSDAPFSLEDMTLFLGILRDEADVDPEAVQKVGEKIHAYLGSLGIHGEDAKASLENLMKAIIKHNAYVSDMFSGLIG